MSHVEIQELSSNVVASLPEELSQSSSLSLSIWSVLVVDTCVHVWKCVRLYTSVQNMLFPWQTNQVKSYDHLLMSPVKTNQGFSHSTVSILYQEWSTTQRTSSQLDTIVRSIGVNMGQHPCGTLSTPCADVLRLFWGNKGVQHNIRKVFLMFCSPGVCDCVEWIIQILYFPVGRSP
jgi:hypothetical protein